MTDTPDYIEATELDGVFIIKRPTFDDPRGFFREVYRANDLNARLGFDFLPIQTNHSRSQKDTLRGIHIAPWHKLITVLSGSIQAVIVDTRPESPTFGRHISITIGDNNRCAVFIPAGCGNAFLVTSDSADYMYQVTDYWAPGKETSLIYNDPDLNISWQTSSPLLSDKDLQNSSVRELFPEKF